MYLFKRSRFVLTLAILLLMSAVAQAQSLPDFTHLVEQYGPSVVNISTTQKHGGMQYPEGMPDLPPDSPLGELFRHFFGEGHGGEGMPDQPRSLGSGFIIGEDGYIITNNHVVEDASEILVLLNDRRELEAEVIGADERSDIALLKVDASGLPVVKIARNKQHKVGEWVMAIGSPFGFDHSVSVGVISALGRSLPRETYVPFIQTDVAINPGNSGGPLFNLDGEVIGVNSQIYSRSGGFMGLSFAIPIDVVMDTVEQLRDKGYVSRGWLGVLIQDVTRELAESFGMKRPRGALISQILEGSPAEKADLQVGDIILEFNGSPLNHSSDLPPLVGRSSIGKPSKVKILRDGESVTVSVVIGELPEQEEIAAQQGHSKPKGQVNRLGLELVPLDEQYRNALGYEGSGVVVKKVEAGAARSAGVRRGDVVVKLNGKTVKSLDDFSTIVAELPESRSVPMLVQRKGGPLFLALKLEGEDE